MQVFSLATIWTASCQLSYSSLMHLLNLSGPYRHFEFYTPGIEFGAAVKPRFESWHYHIFKWNWGILLPEYYMPWSRPLKSPVCKTPSPVPFLIFQRDPKPAYTWNEKLVLFALKAIALSVTETLAFQRDISNPFCCQHWRQNNYPWSLW